MTQRSKNKSNFKKGSVEMLLLHLLKTEGDCYGYQLSQLINQRSGGVLVIPEGSMYPTLYKLIDNSYITDYKKTVGKRMTPVSYTHLDVYKRQAVVYLALLFVPPTERRRNGD